MRRICAGVATPPAAICGRQLRGELAEAAVLMHEPGVGPTQIAEISQIRRFGWPATGRVVSSATISSSAPSAKGISVTTLPIEAIRRATAIAAVRPRRIRAMASALVSPRAVVPPRVVMLCSTTAGSRSADR